MENFGANLIRATDSNNSEDFVSPDVVVAVVDCNGVRWTKSSGDVDVDSVMFFASQGKLFTVVAAMQAVERGLIGLDDDVAEHLPELAALPVLDSQDENGEWKTSPRKAKISLRHLLTHTSGAGYDMPSPELREWKAQTGLKSSMLDGDFKIFESLPLLFEPGTGWAYGGGVDWAGELVARLNHTKLESYLQMNVCQPLGLTSTTFHPENLRDWPQRRHQCYLRMGSSSSVEKIPIEANTNPTRDCGGHGIFSTPTDFMKLLVALLNDGGAILSKQSVEEILRPQGVPGQFAETILGDLKPLFAPSLLAGSRMDHGLGGMVNLADIPQVRKAGTIQWSGAPNMIWWLDRTSGIAAASFMQLFPPGDARAGMFNIEFESAVYRELNQVQIESLEDWSY
ncbi:hypothetical protein H2204_004912 [Knufia peltigerae]|uniref:Beta-lactamase-related domain-containing protein n=1 Tax=Knufia peltigerae TaxID=1002370 RepID=A0AA39CY90_9EURO|nr:hypothetical protein H2204_004912 [Knufia peltigerae]